METLIGVSNTKKFSTCTGSLKSSNKKVTLSMIHNPSHLESKNSITMGKARAKIDDFGKDGFSRVLNIQAHGDAAFAAQGSVYESLSLSKLPNFDCGGTIHLITNNQVGFSTSQEESRSFRNSSGIVKAFGVPIIQINAADKENTPETLIKVCKFAVDYWKKYKKDILIDLVGFRKNGHNEVDEPMFTQPHMYKKIKELTPLALGYGERLVAEGVMTQQQIDKTSSQIEEHFDQEFQQSKDWQPKFKETINPNNKGSRSMTHKWAGMDFSQDGLEPEDTGFDVNSLKQLAKLSV